MCAADPVQPDACPHAYLIARVAVCRYCERLHVLSDSADGPSQRAVLERLAPQQQRVARLLAEGLSYADIAHTMGLSRHTINHYIRGIFDRLGVCSRHEAILTYVGVLPLRDPDAPPAGTERSIEQAPGWQTEARYGRRR